MKTFVIWSIENYFWYEIEQLTFDFEVKLFSLYACIHGNYNYYQTVAIGYGSAGVTSFFPPIEDSYEI